METIGDKATDDARIGKRRADNTGGAMTELTHRVVEMRHRSRAGVEGAVRFLGCRLRVAEITMIPLRANSEIR